LPVGKFSIAKLKENKRSISVIVVTWLYVLLLLRSFNNLY